LGRNLTAPAPVITGFRPLDPDGYPSIALGARFEVLGANFSSLDSTHVVIATYVPTEGIYGSPLPDPSVGPDGQRADLVPVDGLATQVTAQAPQSLTGGPGKYSLYVVTTRGGFSNPACVMITPAPSAAASLIEVGVFDPSSGRFDGLTTEEIEYQPAPNKPERTRKVTPCATADLPRAKLIYQVQDLSGSLTVQASPNYGQEHPARNTVIVDVGEATSVTWTVRSGSRSYHDRLLISHPRPSPADTRQQQAEAALDNFQASTKPSVFTRISKDGLIRDMRCRIRTPSLVNQTDQPLCGPSAILVALAIRNPVRYAVMGQDFYERGAFIASDDYTIRPGSDLLGAPAPGSMSPADWMPAATMRDYENSVLDYDAGDLVAGTTWPGEMEKWFRQVLQCGSTDYISCYVYGEADALRSARDAINKGGVATLMIDSQYLRGGGDIANLPDHWVLLKSVDSAEEPYRFSVYTWGDVKDLTLNQDELEDLLWGVVIGY
jgi:hypothetical protein